MDSYNAEKTLVVSHYKSKTRALREFIIPLKKHDCINWHEREIIKNDIAEKAFNRFFWYLIGLKYVVHTMFVLNYKDIGR